ncbi:MAG TPA: hypothetical protein VI756_02020, partial [Blastocatellia bacterium]
VVVRATYPGSGANSTNGVVSFDPAFYNERSALLGQAFMPLLTDFACVDRTNCNAVFSATSVISFEADGTILIFGGIGAERESIYAASYTQDGALNTSFGNNGLLTAKFVPVGDLNVVAFGTDGTLVAAGGMHHAGLKEEFALARYTVPGS